MGTEEVLPVNLYQVDPVYQEVLPTGDHPHQKVLPTVDRAHQEVLPTIEPRQFAPPQLFASKLGCAERGHGAEEIGNGDDKELDFGHDHREQDHGECDPFTAGALSDPGPT